jgi:hypothetical protein
MIPCRARPPPPLSGRGSRQFRRHQTLGKMRNVGGGGGGEANAHGESDVGGRKWEEGIYPWFL